jgi:hypothetical protein
MKRAICVAMATLGLGCVVGCVDEMAEPRLPTHAAGTTTTTTGSRVASPFEHKFGQFDPIDVSASTTASDDVKVMDGDPGCATEALGVVESSDGDRAHALEAMRSRAGALGAEMLVEVTKRGAGYAATAVRCRDLREGRPYEVMEKITIPIDGGGEDAAFAALRARAFDMKADLIIDITKEPTRIIGTAIRYR